MPAERWTDEFLNQMRETTDPLADGVVAAVYESGSVDRVNRLLTDLIGLHPRQPDALPPVVADYLKQSAALPSWIDPAKVSLGEKLFGEWGVNSCTILACASLPECYLMKNGIHVLALTQRLEQHAQRRVLETAQMIMAVMFPGGLAQGGVGVRTAQKVRLMHAAIRFLVLHQPPADTKGADGLPAMLHQERWPAERGKPINQEDLAFTLMTFSFVGVRSLERLGARLLPADRDAYVHCWNVVGHVMGIRDELLPADYQEAGRLFEIIKKRQAGRTEAALKMQAALLAFVERLMPSGPLKRLPVFVTRQLIDAEDAETLGIPATSGWEAFVQKLVFRVWRWVDRDLSKLYGGHQHLSFASAWLHDLLMAEIGRMPAGWDHQLFNMPKNLLANLPPDWKRDPVRAPSTLTEGLWSRL